MAKVNINALIASLGFEDADVHVVKAPDADGVAENVKDVDSNTVSVKDIMEEQAEGHCPDDVVKVKEGGDFTSSTEEHGETVEMSEVETPAYQEDVLQEEGELAEDAFGDLDTTEEGIAALENYREVLVGMQSKGYEISPELSRVMQIGLESMHITDDVEFVVSVEDSDDVSSTESTLDKVIARLKKLWTLAKNIALKALEHANNFWNHLSTTTSGLKKAVEKTKTALDANKNKTAIEISSPSPLLFVGSDVTSHKHLNDFQKVLEVVTSDYPTVIHDVCGKIERELGDFKAGTTGVTEETLTRFGKAIPNAALKGLFGNMGETTVGEALAESKVFLGGKALLIEAAGDPSLVVRSMGLESKLFDIRMFDLRASVKAKVTFSPAEVQKILDSCVKLIDTIDVGNEMRKTAKEVQKQFSKEVPKREGDLDAKFIAANLKARMMKDAIRMNVQFVGYAVRVIKAHITLVHAFATQPDAK